MLNTLRLRAPTWPASKWLRSRWDTVASYWLIWDKGDLLFFAAMALPIVVIGLLVRLAYMDQLHMEAQRQRRAELWCLAENVYHEARGEPTAGQYAVAEVTLNRVASPHFPATVCEVVHEKRWDVGRRRYVSAFSWTEFESMHRPRGEAWEQAMAAATAVYNAEQPPVVPGALFYHARHIKPRWARTKTPIARIGKHVFYE